MQCHPPRHRVVDEGSLASTRHGQRAWRQRQARPKQAAAPRVIACSSCRQPVECRSGRLTPRMPPLAALSHRCDDAPPNGGARRQASQAAAAGASGTCRAHSRCRGSQAARTAAGCEAHARPAGPAAGDTTQLQRQQRRVCRAALAQDRGPAQCACAASRCRHASRQLNVQRHERSDAAARAARDAPGRGYRCRFVDHSRRRATNAAWPTELPRAARKAAHLRAVCARW